MMGKHTTWQHVGETKGNWQNRIMAKVKGKNQHSSSINFVTVIIDILFNFVIYYETIQLFIMPRNDHLVVVAEHWEQLETTRDN